MRSMLAVFFTTFSVLTLPSSASENATREQQLSPQDYTLIEDLAKTEIRTPSLKDRKILKIKLKNGVEAILVSDPHIEKSAAAMVVRTGSWEDPIDHPGLAHFTEHMLFLGTKKYPEESGYQRYIAENGGLTNAFTTNDFTAYMFSVNNNAFEEALDRFSNFFKEPLFNPSGVSRELQAIDQEYAKNVQDDDIRQLYVSKELSNPDHPNFQFGMGNSGALANVTQDTLIKWYQEHYSANIMRLIVYSPLPLDTLKNLVVTDFSDIVNKNKTVMATPQVPMASQGIQSAFIQIEPFKDIRSLALVWNLPAKFADLDETRPDALACYILGHEGKESLLAQLKAEGLAEKLKCGSGEIGPGTTIFYLDIALTDEGVNNVYEVIHRVFQAIAGLKQKGIPSYIYQNYDQVAKLNYEFMGREETFSLIMSDALRLGREEVSTYPERSFLIKTFDPEAFKELVDFLTPENTQFYLTAPSSLTNVTPDKKEKWLGVDYSVSVIKAKEMDKWAHAEPHPNIDLPQPNPFIPQDLSLKNSSNVNGAKSSEIPTPKPILNSDHALIYYAPDTHFGVPQIYWYIEVKTPKINPADEKNMALADLYVKALEESLDTFSYDATQAGLNFEISGTDNGIGIKITGYNDKARVLLDEILTRMKRVTLSAEKFALLKDSLIRDYQNTAKGSPIQQAAMVLKSVIYKFFATDSEKATALAAATHEDFIKYCQNLFEKTYFEGILYGNLTEKEAQSIGEKLLSSLESQAYPKADHYQKEVIILPEDSGPYYLESKTSVLGNAIILAIEGTDYTQKNRAAQQILMQAISNPFFATLRTKQQTGYIVHSMDEEIEKILFNLFIIQSSTHDVHDLIARIELFLESFNNQIYTKFIPEPSFNNIKMALVDNLKFSYNNIGAMGELLKTLGFKYDGDFGWVNKRLQGFEELSYAEFLEAANELLGKGNKRRLAILVKGVLHENQTLDYTKIDSVNQLRRRSTFTKTSEN